MATPAVQEEQLLELLLQLKKTTPDQARAILNSQPQIACALMTVMVNISAVNVEVVQKTISGALTAPGAAGPSAQPPIPVPAPVLAPVPPPAMPGYPYGQMPPPQPIMQPPSAIPPHLQNVGQPSRGGTPPFAHNVTPPYPRGGTPTMPRAAMNHTPPQPPPQWGYQAPPPVMQPPPSQQSYNAPRAMQPPPYGQPPPPPAMTPALQEALSTMSEEQRVLIMRVVQMTPDEIQRLPPPERSNIMQLRQTLGIPL